MEPFQFGRGWTLEKLTVEMISPRYLPLIGYADAWSPSTNGELVASPVFLGGKTPELVETMRAQLKGAIVMTDPIMTNFVRKDRPQPSDPDYAPMSAAYATSVGQRPGGRGATPAQAIAQTRSRIRSRRHPQAQPRRARHGIRHRAATSAPAPSPLSRSAPSTTT